MVERWRSEQDALPVSVAVASEDDEILCCVRKRPLLYKEIEARVFDVVSCQRQGAPPGSVVLHEPVEKVTAQGSSRLYFTWVVRLN